jgi:hypothetical protein
MLSRMLDLNQPQVGYEPTLIPDHTGVEESSGNDPQSESHRSQCLAGMPRRLQGLLSICAHHRLRSDSLHDISVVLSRLS